MPSTAPRTWLAGDYNQAEVRVVAWKAPVPKLKTWFIEKKDVHNHVCALIARVVQENKITTPLNPDSGAPLFHSKPPNDYRKGDEERELSKRCVHAYDYGMGAEKFALITGISYRLAQILLEIYGALFPEIKRDYHGWVERTIKTTKTIRMPEPVAFIKEFHSVSPYAPLDDNTLRSAYSCYPQCTIGALLIRTLGKCCSVFLMDTGDELRPQWEAYYGKENYDRWRLLRSRNIRTPEAITWGGLDIRLNIHDSCVMSIPDDPDLIAWAAKVFKETAEVPVQIAPGNELVVPVDFKKGKTLASEDQVDYKLPNVI
jgi:hypothetical protein